MINTDAIIGIGGRNGPISMIDKTGNNTNLRNLVDDGIRKGNTKLMRINPKTGDVEESNGLNYIGTGAIINIQV